MRLSGCAAMPMPTFPLARLGGFRRELHACFTRRADALFELGDALLCAQSVPSLPHLSLEPVHRRGWGSTYAALACGRIDADRLRDLLAECLPDADPPVFAVDVTTWPRCDAECSPERGYYYHPSYHPWRHSAGQPIIAGWAYQWIAGLSFARDSWTAPVDARRLHPLDDTDHAATAPSSTAPTRPPGPPHRHPDWSGRPGRQRDRGGLERAASQTAAPPRPRQPRTPTDRARHHPRCPGRASPGPHPPTQGAVAVVVRPRRARPGPGLAGLDPPVRPGTHRPVRQADPRLDHPTAPPSRPGRPVDLAGAGRLHPAAPDPHGRHRRPTTVAAVPIPAATLALSGAPRVSAAVGRARLAGRRTKTLRMLLRPTQGPGVRACGPPPGDQEAGQEVQEQASQDRKGHLTGPAPSSTPPTSVDGQPGIRWVN